MKHHTSPSDDVIKGAALVSVAVFLIATQSAFGKWLGQTYHPIELTFYRNITLLLTLSVYFQSTQKWALIKTKRLPSHIGRALVGTVGITFFIWSLIYLPLPEATSLAFTTPLFVVLLSYPLLKEKVGPLRYIAVILGFVGVLIISHPDTSHFAAIGIMLAISGAFCNGLVQIYLRDLGKTEHTLTTVFHFMFWGTIATGAFLPFIWTGPKWSDMALILGLCLAGALQQVIKTKGYSLAPVVVTSPLSYVSLIWATLFGYMFWNDIPSVYTILGATIIIGSNLFILWREYRKKHD